MQKLSPLLLLAVSNILVVGEYFLLSFGFNLYPEITALSAYFWGFLGAGVFLICMVSFYAPHKKLVVKNFVSYWKAAFLLAVLLSVMGILWFYSLGNAPAGIISFLDRLSIPFSFLLGVVLLKDRFTILQFFSLLLSGLGFFLMFNINENIEIFPLLSVTLLAVIFSFQSVFVKKYLNGYEFISFTYMRNIFAVFLVIPILYFFNFIDVIPFPAMIIFSIASLLGFFIARILYFEAHKYISVGEIQLFSLTQPVVVLFLSVLLLGEDISQEKLFASMCITLGLYVFFKNKNS